MAEPINDDVSALCSEAEISPTGYRRFSRFKFAPEANPPAKTPSPQEPESPIAKIPVDDPLPRPPADAPPPAPAEEFRPKRIAIERLRLKRPAEAAPPLATAAARMADGAAPRMGPSGDHAPFDAGPSRDAGRRKHSVIQRIFSRGLDEPTGWRRLLMQPALPIYAASPGVGTTTFIATLSRALSLAGRTVVIVDGAIPSLLPLYFGGDSVPGPSSFAAPRHDSPLGAVHIIAREHDTNPQDDRWVMTALGRHTENQQPWILADMSSELPESLHGVFLSEGSALVLLAPDVASVLRLNTLLQYFASKETAVGSQIAPYFLLTKFDPANPVHDEIRRQMQEQLGPRLLPFYIERSDEFAEALAEGGTILDTAPASRNAKLFSELTSA